MANIGDVEYWECPHRHMYKRVTLSAVTDEEVTEAELLANGIHVSDDGTLLDADGTPLTMWTCDFCGSEMVKKSAPPNSGEYVEL